jgi:hypothetical protein
MKKRGLLEKVMKFWAQALSVIAVGMLLYYYYLLAQLFFVYNDHSIWLIISAIGFPFMMLVYSHFFYFGWVDNPDSKEMKTFSKVFAIIFTIIFSGVFIVNIGNVLTKPAIEFIKGMALILLLLLPSYYYGWRK